MVTKKCPNCDSLDIIEDGEQCICKECGLLFENRLHEIALGSQFEVYSRGVTTILNISNRKLNSTYTVNSSDRSLQIVRGLIAQWSYQLLLNDSVRDYGLDIYEQLIVHKKTQGRRIDELAAACLHIASRVLSPRPLQALERVTMVDAKKITKFEKVILKELELRLQLVEAKQFVPFLCSSIDRNFSTEKRAITLLTDFGDMIQNPRTAAASAVYYGAILAGDPITLPAAAKLMDISEHALANGSNTLRSAYETV